MPHRLKIHIAFLMTLTFVFNTAALAADSPAMSTVAGNGDKTRVGQPFGVEFGPDGALYICDVQNHRIHRLDPKTKELTVIAGTGERGYSGDGGPATRAALNEPYEIRFDDDANIYFVEMKNAIVRRIDHKTGAISTVAGTGQVGFSGDGGSARRATFNKPHSIAIHQNHLYIADIGNHRIRRVDLNTGAVQTIAGTGEKTLPVEGAIAKGNAVVGPRALFIQGDQLYVALREGHSVWKLSLTDGRWRHIAGTGQKGFTGDGASAKTATFNGPKGITVTQGGIIFVVDTENQTIRRIDPKADRISTVAGVGPDARGYNGDNLPATQSHMDRPHGIGLGPANDRAIYIGDTNNHRVRRVPIQ